MLVVMYFLTNVCEPARVVGGGRSSHDIETTHEFSNQSHLFKFEIFTYFKLIYLV